MSTIHDNFIEALKMVKPQKKQEIFFRLYYDETGKNITYSMLEMDQDYIEITPEQFAIADPNVYVKDGKIVKKRILGIGKLAPSDKGYPVAEHDFSFIVPDSTFHLAHKDYEDD